MGWLLKGKRLLCFGIAGSLVFAVGSFSSAPAQLLVALGLPGWRGWVESLMVPLLVVFMVLTAFAAAGLVSGLRHGGNGNGSAD